MIENPQTPHAPSARRRMIHRRSSGAPGHCSRCSNSQHQMHRVAGDPEAAVPYLATLARLANDPEGPRRIRLSWIAAESSHGHVKAIGQGRARRPGVVRRRSGHSPLRVQSEGGRGGRQAAGQPTQAAPAEQSAKRAEEILQRINPANPPSESDVSELVQHLPALSPERLQHFRAGINKSWGGIQSKPVNDLIAHVRALTDGYACSHGHTPAIVAEQCRSTTSPHPTRRLWKWPLSGSRLHEGSRVAAARTSTAKPWVVKACAIGSGKQAANEAAAARLSPRSPESTSHRCIT